MAEYDYLNARVRALSTQLLRPPDYERLLAADEEAVLDLLHGTAYRKELAEATAVGRGLAAVEGALARHLASSFARLRAMAPERARHFLGLQAAQWDAANLLAVLRGKLNAAEPREILEASRALEREVARLLFAEPAAAGAGADARPEAADRHG